MCILNATCTKTPIANHVIHSLVTVSKIYVMCIYPETEAACYLIKKKKSWDNYNKDQTTGLKYLSSTL